MPETGDLRVWWVRNPPREAEYHYVNNIEEAMGVLDALAEADLKDPRVVANAGGLEVFGDGVDDDWSEYYDESGADIRELQDERDGPEEDD